MFPQTQPSGQSQVLSRFLQPRKHLSPNSHAHNRGFITSSQTVAPRAESPSAKQVPPHPHPDVPQCDTQPMPSQAAFRTLSTQVHEDYDCTLNQTNIGNNNNKFYIIQLLEEGGRFSCWNRWGRVVSEPSPGLPSPTFPPLGTLQGDPKSHPLTPSPAVFRGHRPSPEAGKHFWWSAPLKVVPCRERWARAR